MDNTVENNLQEPMLDDAAFMEPDVATETEPQQTLAEALSEPTEPSQSTQQESAPPAKSEPGWIRKRIDDGVRKATAGLEQRIRAEYEAQLAPLREAALDRQADQLVAEGKITDKATALEYLRLKGGLPAAPQPETTAPAVQRDARGRFAKAPETPVPSDVEVRGQQLWNEAQTIKAITGVDVMAIYNANEEAKSKILSGEWNFTDVYNAHKGTAQAPRSTPPPAVRSGGYRLGRMSVADMSDAQFDRLNRMLESGASILADE